MTNARLFGTSLTVLSLTKMFPYPTCEHDKKKKSSRCNRSNSCYWAARNVRKMKDF